MSKKAPPHFAVDKTFGDVVNTVFGGESPHSPAAEVSRGKKGVSAQIWGIIKVPPKWCGTRVSLTRVPQTPVEKGLTKSVRFNLISGKKGKGLSQKVWLL